MKRKITYLFLAISYWLLANSCPVFSQSVSPSVIGSAGNYSGVVGGMSISSNVGESAVTTVSNGTITLTQGFEQPFIQITVTSVTASPSSTICAGSNTTLTVNSVGNNTVTTTYAWTPATGLNCTTCAHPVASPTANTTYSVTVADGVNTPGTGTITITVNLTPSVPVVTVNPNPACSGQTVSLTANSSGITYNWNGPSGFVTSTQNPTIPNIGTAASGTYSVTSTN